MEDFLSQIKLALSYNLYYIALQSILTLPDICGALESQNGHTNNEKYKNWYKNNVITSEGISAEDCYCFRCSMVHQAKTKHDKSSFGRIMFIEPGHPYSGMLNNVGFQIGNNVKPSLAINLTTFCNDMIKSAEKWWIKSKNNPIVTKNYQSMVKRYPNGLPPYIGGVPVIS